jgi:acrylyl-CoA reductase (NADPH)
MAGTADFRAFRVEKTGETFSGRVQTVARDTLPPGELTVRVAYSSLNYKDALSATGNPGVTKAYPHTPGIDAAGTVLESSDSRFAVGDEVIVTSYDLGMNTPGGFGELIRVPAAWALALPAGLSLREAMALGTAGLTAGLCLEALLAHGLESDQGPVVVTGASGGVGSVAVALLAKAGFEVVASTGTEAAHGWLRELGAAEIIPRAELSEASERPLLKARFAGAVDTVGGEPLSNLVKSLRYRGAVAACGLVAGPQLSLTVFPFILRGVSLLGIDSAECPMALRRRVWERLAGDWKVDLSVVTQEVALEDLGGAIEEILAGRTQGRVLVRVS